MRNNKGLADIISIVLILGLVIILSSVLLAWSVGLFNKTTKETDIIKSKSINCLNDIDLVIIDVCYDSKIRLTLENRKDGSINGDFMLIKVEGSKDVLIQPTPPATNINAFERKNIELTYFPEIGEIKKVSIIPRIQTEDGAIFCTNNIVESTNIKQGCTG